MYVSETWVCLAAWEPTNQQATRTGHLDLTSSQEEEAVQGPTSTTRYKPAASPTALPPAETPQVQGELASNFLADAKFINLIQNLCHFFTHKPVWVCVTPDDAHCITKDAITDCMTVRADVTEALPRSQRAAAYYKCASIAGDALQSSSLHDCAFGGKSQNKRCIATTNFSV